MGAGAYEAGRARQRGRCRRRDGAARCTAFRTDVFSGPHRPLSGSRDGRGRAVSRRRSFRSAARGGEGFPPVRTQGPPIGNVHDVRLYVRPALLPRGVEAAGTSDHLVAVARPSDAADDDVLEKRGVLDAHAPDYEETCRELAVPGFPLNRVLRKQPTAFDHPKTSSTRFLMRWLPSQPPGRKGRPRAAPGNAPHRMSKAATRSLPPKLPSGKLNSTER